LVYYKQHTPVDVLSMNMSLFTLLKLCVLLNLVSQSDTLKVGSWSFTSFGKTKLSNDEAMATILQVSEIEQVKKQLINHFLILLFYFVGI